MTQPYNQALPFIAIGIVGLVLLAEVAYDIEIDIEAYMPVLVAIGVGGAAKTAIERAGALKKAIPQEIQKIIKDEIRKNLPKDEKPKS